MSDSEHTDGGDSVSAPPRWGAARRWIAEVERDLKSHPAGVTWSHSDAFLFVIICVLLTLFAYYGMPKYFMDSGLSDWTQSWGWGPESRYFEMLPFGYWAAMSLVLRILVPCLIIVYLFKDSISEYGYRFIRGVSHVRIYLALFLGMLPVVVWASTLESFQRKYPFYKDAILGLDHFVLYQLCYGVQFLALEAFFRGFMLFALAKRFGYYAIFIMTIPYCMIHFGKPLPETFGAIFAGIALGYLALKSRSWVYGALLHWSVGITMDLLAIFHRGGFEA